MSDSRAHQVLLITKTLPERLLVLWSSLWVEIFTLEPTSGAGPNIQMDLVVGKWWHVLLTDFTYKMTQQQVHPLTVSEEGSHMELTVGSLRASGFITEEKATLVFYIRFQPSPLKLSSFCTFVYTHASSRLCPLLCAILLAYTSSPLLPDSQTSVKATKQFCNTTHTHT